LMKKQGCTEQPCTFQESSPIPEIGFVGAKWFWNLPGFACAY